MYYNIDVKTVKLKRKIIMDAEVFACIMTAILGICFPFSLVLKSGWKYVTVTGMLISSIMTIGVCDNDSNRKVFYRYANLNPEGWMHITGKGTDAYKVDLTKVKPGCHIVIYHAFDYHGPFFFSPKVLLLEPIKCGDRVANQSEIAYNGAE